MADVCGNQNVGVMTDIDNRADPFSASRASTTKTHFRFMITIFGVLNQKEKRNKARLERNLGYA